MRAGEKSMLLYADNLTMATRITSPFQVRSDV